VCVQETMCQEEEDDPFWVAAFEGSELSAREELMPDREQDDVMCRALTLATSSRRGAGEAGAADRGWTPAEVTVRPNIFPASFISFHALSRPMWF